MPLGMAIRYQACCVARLGRRSRDMVWRIPRSLSSTATAAAPSPPPPADTQPQGGGGGGGGASVNTSSHGAGPSATTTHFGFRDVAVEEKEKLVKDVFDSVASQYDLMNDLMSAGLHRLWKDDFVRMAGIGAAVRQQQQQPAAGSEEGMGIKLLDVAGGTGDIAFRLMKAAHAAARSSSSSSSSLSLPSMTICDINAEMLRVGRDRARTSQHFGGGGLDEVLPRLEWVEGNAECLPFPDQTFDLYTIAFGLRNVTNRDKALKEAFRVLKRGGRFMCLEFSHVSLPVIQQVYDVYSFEVIPRVGQAVTGDRAAYQYLVESIRKFPQQDVLVREVQDVGFRNATYTNYTLGTVAVHSAFRWT